MSSVLNYSNNISEQLAWRSRSTMKWMVSHLYQNQNWCVHLGHYICLQDAGDRVDGQVTQVDFKPQSENALMKWYCSMFSEVIWKSFNHLVWLSFYFFTLSFQKIFVGVKKLNPFSVIFSFICLTWLLSLPCCLTWGLKKVKLNLKIIYV